MIPSRLPLEGGCRCGAVRVVLEAPPLLTAACHCTGCRRMSGSAFALTALVPPAAFRVTAGETVPAGLQGPALQHQACPRCKSWMFTRIVGVEAFLNLRPAVLDDDGWFVPFIETMTREKLPWASTPARHRFAGFPAMKELPALIAEFAEAAGGS